MIIEAKSTAFKKLQTISKCISVATSGDQRDRSGHHQGHSPQALQPVLRPLHAFQNWIWIPDS